MAGNRAALPRDVIEVVTMLNVLKEPYFNEHYAKGFVATGITLPETLVDDIKGFYQAKAEGHNDFPKFFDGNEHQAYLEGRAIGFILNAFPSLGKKMVQRLYDRAYSKAIYLEQACIEKVLRYLLANNFQHIFQTRYIVAAYDMYLRNNHLAPAAGIHTDLPNFHHFYETENDLSLYIPLVDLDDSNGGRITVLPESKLKVPGNVLLKLLYRHFSQEPAFLDEQGYVDPDRITPAAIAAFVKSQPHQDLMALYKRIIGLAKTQYAKEFQRTSEGKGQALLFNNKNFHAAEQWRNDAVDREVYVIRMFPIYDAQIKLKQKIHGTQVNNFLIDTELGEVHRFADAVDFARIPASQKLKL
jgi:hypothetical protein